MIRPLSASPAFEDVLVGTILVNNSAITSVCSGLKYLDFVCPVNSQIWLAIERLLWREELANPITLPPHLRDRIDNPEEVLVRRAAVAAPSGDYDLFTITRAMVGIPYRLTREQSREAMLCGFPQFRPAMVA